MKRIVSLVPGATEALFAVGLGPHVVGVTHECDHPAANPALPRVSCSRFVHSLELLAAAAAGGAR